MMIIPSLFSLSSSRLPLNTFDYMVTRRRKKKRGDGIFVLPSSFSQLFAIPYIVCASASEDISLFALLRFLFFFFLFFISHLLLRRIRHGKRARRQELRRIFGGLCCSVDSFFFLLLLSPDPPASFSSSQLDKTSPAAPVPFCMYPLYYTVALS